MRLDRCQLSKDVTQDAPPVEGKRAREEKDYGLMESGPLGGVIIDYGQVGWRMMSDFCHVVPCMSVG